MPEVQKETEWATGDYGDFLELTPEERAIVEYRLEHDRLEREVIEAAKAERKASLDYDKRMILENWRRTVDTRQQRESAIDALIEFESQHLLKK